jgi:hypothetical protein
MGVKASRIEVVGEHREIRSKGVDAAACVLRLGVISPRDTGRQAAAAKAASLLYGRPILGEWLPRLMRMPVTDASPYPKNVGHYTTCFSPNSAYAGSVPPPLQPHRKQYASQTDTF